MNNESIKVDISGTENRIIKISLPEFSEVILVDVAGRRCG